MTSLEHGINRTFTPFLEQEEIPIDREDIRLEQGFVDDYDVKQFIEGHPNEMHQTDLNLPVISKLKPSEALTYKILHGEDEELAGLVFLVRKGMDYGDLQIAYVVADEYQGQGMGKESVSAVTNELSDRYALIANIHETNERSAHIVKSLGYYAAGDSRSDFVPYIRLKQNKKSDHDLVA